MIKELHEKLKRIEISKPPVVNPKAGIQWVKPKHMSEITYREFTHLGMLRHTVFLRLRSDKKPKECTAEDQLSKKNKI